MLNLLFLNAETLNVKPLEKKLNPFDVYLEIRKKKIHFYFFNVVIFS
jgi:hypothetical protein